MSERITPVIERAGGFLSRLRNTALGRVMLGTSLALAPAAAVTLAAPNAAHADTPNYGDYLSGKDPREVGCGDVRTLSSTVLSKSGGALSVNVGPVGVNTGADTGGIGVIELRYSEECGTAWARLRTSRANDITYVGIEKDDGYRQQISINGNWPGSPAANSYTPMIYGRGGDVAFRAYVFSQELYDVTPDNNGTYWMTPTEPTPAQ